MITLFGKPEPTLLERLKDAAGKTRSQLAAQVETLLAGEKRIDANLLVELERALLSADLGMAATRDVLEAVREKMGRAALADGAALKRALKARLLGCFPPAPAPLGGPPAAPLVIFVVGVNGVGKTTTIGKLAHRIRAEGRTVLLCAADTFRAAATEQLEIWAQRAGLEIIKQKHGADPAAVVFDAVAAGKARGCDAVIVDTAGRLHTKSNLMAELEKMKRTAAKVIPGAPHEVLLVMDATTGQNGLAQARQFTSAVGVTGIVLTKLDGTAKGGIVVAIARELALPIRFVGTGEKIDDLVPFDPPAFVNSLLD